MADETPTPTPTPTITPTASVTPTPTVTPTVTPYIPPVTPSTSAPPTFETLIQAYPELENSLTLNPAGSAEMLNPDLRAQEIFYADRAREGEFGYSVRRRLHHMGYNV